MRVLVTGLENSGKTTIIKKAIANKNKVIYTDEWVKDNLYIKNSPIWFDLISLAGDDIIVDGKVDTAILRKKMLSGDVSLDNVVQLIYPFLIDFISKNDDMIYEMGGFIRYEELFNSVFDVIILVKRPGINGSEFTKNDLNVKYDHLIVNTTKEVATDKLKQILKLINFV